jgi:AraC family transcriptional regulator
MEEITLIEVPSLQVLGIRQKGNYRMIPEMLGQIFAFARKNRVAIAGMPMFILHETSGEAALEADRTGTADVEVVVPVSGRVRGRSGIHSYALSGGRMARIMHHGPYEQAERSYLRLMVWIAERGLRVVGPLREVYHNNPQEVPPQEILTEILAPVE